MPVIKSQGFNITGRSVKSSNDPSRMEIIPPPLTPFGLCFLPVLDQLLVELHHFLLILDNETLSGNATIQKGLLSDLLQSYRASNGKVGEKGYLEYQLASVSKASIFLNPENVTH